MINIRKQLLFIGLVFGLMASSIQLIVNIYDYRVTFSEIEKFNKKYEDLSFKSNLLLNEVEYFRNQLTIREVATGKLGMRSPKLKEQVVIHRQVVKKMKRITFLIIILLSLGCSKNIDYENLNEIDISISSDHKILSSSDLIKETFLSFLNEQVIDFSSVSKDLYKTTWVYAFQAKRKWPNLYSIRVKEHQPLAKWGDNKFLTHSGILIKPSIDDSNIHLVLLKRKGVRQVYSA